MVKIVLNNLTSKIIGYLPDEVHTQLDKALSYRVKNARFSPKFKAKQWDGIIRLYQRNRGQSFYSGLLSFVVPVLEANEIPYQKVDERVKPTQNLPHLVFNPPLNYEERDYQQFTINRALQRSRGILKVATGGGKTIIVSETIAGIKTAPFMFYVLTRDLLKQAHEELSRTLNEEIGIIGGGKCEIHNINVCTIQTAIRALHIGEKIKVSDYRFDEDDIWSKEDLLSMENLKKLRTLIYSLKGIYFDECISGDSILKTEKGMVRIDEIKKKNCRYVLTYDGINVVYKPIRQWLPKGTKKTIKLFFETGDIRCTTDHLIYTNKGWKKAGRIKTGDKVLFADVGAVNGLTKTDMEGQEHMFLDTKLKNKALKNGNQNLIDTLEILQNVNVVAKTKSNLHMTQLNLLSIQEELLDIHNTSKNMTNSQFITNTILPLLKKKWEPLWEPAWETLPSSFQIKDLETIDCVQLMDSFKKSGLNTNQILSNGLESLLETFKTMDMEIIQQECGQDVCRVLQRFRALCTIMEENKSQRNGSILLETLDLLGGFATTEAILIIECLLLFILKDLALKKIKLSKDGLMKKGLVAKSRKAKNITICYLMLRALLKSKKSYNNMSRPVCNTNWQTVQHITENKKELVYDIEVKDTHCFFANNILVHNCHHAAAKTCKEVLSASPNAYWRFAGSATPFREDGAEIIIQAMFGKKIVDISASYLIDRNHLAEPTVIFEPIEQDCNLHAYPSVYKQCIIENKDFNIHVANTAKYLNSKGKSVLILVTQYAQGDYLKTLLPDTTFVTGRMTSKKRAEAIDRLRNGEDKCMIATTLADEGLDIPTLDAVLMAGGGASATRVNQRIGRALRKDKKSKNPKTKALAIYYNHHKVKHLSGHAKKVKKILKLEPRFNVIDSSGEAYLFQEIDEAFGFNTKNHPTLFDL